MSKKKYNADQLEDNILIEASIECTKCKSGDLEMHTDQYYAADEFFKKGWRATPNNVYCPKCAKTYLKK